MNPLILVLNSWLFDPKPQMAWRLILALYMVDLHQFHEGYNCLMVFELWVSLENSFFICGTHLCNFCIILDTKPNGTI